MRRRYTGKSNVLFSLMAALRWFCFLFSALLVFTFSACSPDDIASHRETFGEAYVGPVTLSLHREISPKSPIDGTLKHGDRVDVLGYRRRYVKVAGPGRVEGWTDVKYLMSAEQVEALRKLAAEAKILPSQGMATSTDPLNIHTEANRASPGFLQLPAGAKMEVLEHKVAPRTQPAPEGFKITPRPKVRRRPRMSKNATKIPLPAPPGPPENWIALSEVPPLVARPKSPEPQPEPPPKKVSPKPVPMEDWSLVRTPDGRAGWVLSRMLNMAIPDEIAQYSEGHRITSYFPMGVVEDGGMQHREYLWTTISKNAAPYDFDSFRYFIWNRNHHRYETAYVERKLTGYYPVRVDMTQKYPAFSLILEDDDGKLYKNSYEYQIYRVRLVNRAPYNPAEEAKAEAAAQKQPAQFAAKTSWFSRMKQKMGRLFGR